MTDTDNSHYLLQFFTFEQKNEHLAEVAGHFAVLAGWLDDFITFGNPEKTAALRKLLEAKDCALRAMKFVGKENLNP